MLNGRPLREEFEENGFVHLRNFFTPADIRVFREAAATLPHQPHASKYHHEIPTMVDFWRDPRLLDVAQQLLDPPIVYFFDATFLRYNFEPGVPVYGRHMHHDAKGTPDHLFSRLNTAQNAAYPVIRCAVYLQDTTNFSGGLKVAPGSHRTDVSHFDAGELHSYNVPSMPGDLVIFSNRLLHSPFGLRLKSDPERSIAPLVEDEMAATQPELFLPIPQVRETLFIDYTTAHEMTDIYIKNRAVMGFKSNSSLAQFIDESGFLERYKDGPVRFRIDLAIVETVYEIYKSSKNKEFTQASVPYLQRLLRLCRAHWESSDHYPLLPAGTQIPDDSLGTAARLTNELLARIGTYRNMHASRAIDTHMDAYKMEELLAFRVKGQSKLVGAS